VLDALLIAVLSAGAAYLGVLFAYRKKERLLLESKANERRFRELTALSADWFWETDAEHRIVWISGGAPVATFFGQISTYGRHFWEIPQIEVEPRSLEAHRERLQNQLPFFDLEIARTDERGARQIHIISGQSRFDAQGRFAGYRGVGRDITEIALARERIASLAYSDPLTGLANRTSLSPALEQAVERARRRGAKLAGVFMDLDGFKQINDAHGHDIGDGLLIDVARRLRTVLRASDFVARLGGDEFFVVIEEVHDVPAVDGIARKLLSELLEPYELAGGKRAQITASLGVSVFPDDAGDAQTLMKHADMAMYAAKEAGKNSYRFYLVEPVSEATYERTNPRAA